MSLSTQEQKLKAIADAIREKDGSTDPIIANDFPDRIRAIQSDSKETGGYEIIENRDKDIYSATLILKNYIGVVLSDSYKVLEEYN